MFSNTVALYFSPWAHFYSLLVLPFSIILLIEILQTNIWQCTMFWNFIQMSAVRSSDLLVDDIREKMSFWKFCKLFFLNWVGGINF